MKEYFKIIAPFVSSLKEGHTGVMHLHLPEYHTYKNGGGLLFPFDVFIKDKRLWICEDYTKEGTVPAGSEILVINNYPASVLIQELLNFVSGERMAWRYWLLSKNFKVLLWLIYGFGETFQLEFKSPESFENRRLDILGISHEEMLQKWTEMQLGKTGKWRYRSMPELKTGIIDFTSMRDSRAFKTFLKNTFTRIKDDSIEYLIIDIRDNGGGNSFLGNMLLNYITDQPFSQFSGTEIKITRQIKKAWKQRIPCLFRWIPSFLFPDADFRKIMSTKEGSVICIPARPQKPTKNPLRFKGQIYVCIGTGTFSSAVAFASAVKDYGMGILVGEETGGLATTYGNPYLFSLPSSKIEVYISQQKYIRPNGEDTGRGLIPDTIVNMEIADMISKKDPVIDYVLSRIRKARIY